MAVVLSSGTCVQRGAPVTHCCNLPSRPCLNSLLSRSRKASWISARRRCARTLVVNMQTSKSQCKQKDASSSSSSTSSAEAKETSIAKSRLDAPTMFLRQNIAQGFALQAAAAVAAGVMLWGGSDAFAVDTLKTCACLLKECRVELARCIADPKCAANVACLQTCNGRPDETECQIGCGDLFENDVVDQFNDCAVSRKGCVPQKADEGRFPIPGPEALVPEFDTTRFVGTWYITSGYNKTFDTFDCQKHEFSAAPSKVTGELNWRIPTPDGGFFTRSAVQNFVQDPKQPGILLNHGNEFLNYQDDWYILASKIENKKDDYVFIYYRGKNDAWDGYGGAVVYTKSPSLPESIVPDLRAAAKRVNLNFDKFTTTDNTCGPEPPLYARIEKTVEKGENFVEREVEEGEKFVEQEVEEGESLFAKFGQTLQKFQAAIFGEFDKDASELRRDEELLLQELGDEEKQILKDLEMDAASFQKLFGSAVPLRKLR